MHVRFCLCTRVAVADLCICARRLQAHERRLRQFKSLAVDAQPDESAWGVLQRGSMKKPKLSLAPSETATSKRAEKKACISLLPAYLLD